jgi:hypothetical protein
MSNEKDTTLTEILKQVEKSTVDEQIKKICDQIMTEERPKFLNPESEPKGPNIFLAIQCNKEGSKNVSFVTLEREMKEKYIITFMTAPISKKNNLKRRKVWDVTESKPEKVLKYFSEVLNFTKENFNE